MMDEQRLQEIEAQLRDAGISTHWVGCETTHTHCAIRVLITEVRRLQQQEQQWQGWQESKMILLNSEMALCAERDAALAERDAAERNEREYRAACEMSIGALRDSRERWEQRTVLAEAERDAARAASQNAHECLFETEQSLSEARRVLRAQDECMVCKAELFRDLTVPHCFDCVVEDEHAEEWDAICAAKAAVLAQDTDA